MSYGDIVKKARKSKNFTIRELAARLSVAPSTITRIESGDIPDPKPTLKKNLQAILGIDTNVQNVTDPDKNWELKIAAGFISFAAPLIRMQFGVLEKQESIKISFDTSSEQGNHAFLQPDFNKTEYLKVKHGIGEDKRIRFDANDLIQILNSRNADAICISGPVYDKNWDTKLEEKPVKIAHLSHTAHTGVYLKFFFSLEFIHNNNLTNISNDNNIITTIESIPNLPEIPLLFVPKTLSEDAYGKFTPLLNIPFIGVPIINPFDFASDYKNEIDVAITKGVFACILWEPHLSWVTNKLPNKNWIASKKIHFTKLAIEFNMGIQYFTFDLVTTQARLKNKDKIRSILKFLDLYTEEINEIKRTIKTKELLDVKTADFLGMNYNDYDNEIKRINFGVQYTAEFITYINRYK